MAGYARKERSFLQHMQRAGTQSGCAQRAASHKCGGRERERERERRAQAIAHRSHAYTTMCNVGVQTQIRSSLFEA